MTCGRVTASRSRRAHLRCPPPRTAALRNAESAAAAAAGNTAEQALLTRAAQDAAAVADTSTPPSPRSTRSINAASLDSSLTPPRPGPPPTRSRGDPRRTPRAEDIPEPEQQVTADDWLTAHRGAVADEGNRRREIHGASLADADTARDAPDPQHHRARRPHTRPPAGRRSTPWWRTPWGIEVARSRPRPAGRGRPPSRPRPGRTSCGLPPRRRPTPPFGRGDAGADRDPDAGDRR